MYEPRFKDFPDDYERKIGDTYWQGICEVQIKDVQGEKSPSELVEIDATKKFLKEIFGAVRTFMAGASYQAGWHLVFMIKYKEWDEYTKEQQELHEHHGDFIGVKVRELIR